MDNLKNCTMLYVEDNENVMDVMLDILSEYLKEIYIAKDGFEALKLYKEHHPNIVLSDVMMPRMDGIEMAQKIKEIDKNQVIGFLTAFDTKEQFMASIDIGVDKYFLKPIIDIKKFIASLEDMSLLYTQRKELEEKRDEVDRLQNLLSRAILYTTTDLNGKITSVSKAFEEFSGYKESELIGKRHSIHKTPHTPSSIYKKMWDTLQQNKEFKGEIENLKKDKTTYWAKVVIFPMFDKNGVKIGYGSYREDITNSKKLEYVSTHDTLTEIYNRRYFQKELIKKIKSAQRYNQDFGLIILDIDYFKSINDTYGHNVGDKILKELAQLIEKNIREDDVFARWGGEEFVIIGNCIDADGFISFANKIQENIRANTFSTIEKLRASMGVTLYKDSDDSETIIKRADDALYLSKKNGRDKITFI